MEWEYACRAGNRFNGRRGNRDSGLGFRLARSVALDPLDPWLRYFFDASAAAWKEPRSLKRSRRPRSDRKSEVRSQMTEIGCQMSEDRGRRTEYRGLKSEDREEKSEV